MTIQELYGNIGGNYEHALQIMRKETMVERYILKLQKSSVGDTLRQAAPSMDAEMLFEAAHAMKGVCANLGLDDLSAKASDLAEEFRPGNPRKMSDDEAKALVGEILGMYDNVVKGIDAYAQEHA